MFPRNTCTRSAGEEHLPGSSAPQPLELRRASTEPGPVTRYSWESAITFDKHQDDVQVLSAPPGLSPPPPPHLELEAYETYDPFECPAAVDLTTASATGSCSVPATNANYLGVEPRDPEHGLLNPFSTLPRPDSGYAGLSGQIKYEWCDTEKQAASLTAVNSCMSHCPCSFMPDLTFLPLPPNEPPKRLATAPVPIPPPPLCAANSADIPFTAESPSMPPSSPPAEPQICSSSEPAVPQRDATTMEFAKQPSGITCTVFGSVYYIYWQVDARKLESQDKQAVSPQFIVDLAHLGPLPFKIALHAKVSSDGKRGSGFKKAKGRGKVVLKCEAELSASTPEICFRIGIGRGEMIQRPRGPVAHNFYEQSVGGLAKEDEEWDFTMVVDEMGSFVVSVAFASTISALSTSSFAWNKSS